MILHDHWQGEACVAIFGALGWAIIAYFAPDGRGLDANAYNTMRALLPDIVWQFGFVTFGVLQLFGLANDTSSGAPGPGGMLRLIGAGGVFFLLLVCFNNFLFDAPWALGICGYMVCISIEACAIVYLAARAVRFREYRLWRTGRA